MDENIQTAELQNTQAQEQTVNENAAASAADNQANAQCDVERQVSNSVADSGNTIDKRVSKQARKHSKVLANTQRHNDVADNSDCVDTQSNQSKIAAQEDAADNITNSGVEDAKSDTHNNIPQEIEEESHNQQQPSLSAAEEQGEKNSDTPNTQKQAVYMTDGWQDKVEEFFKTYPVAKGFATMIGEQLVADAELSKDDNCLEKALARVFDKVYVPPKDLIRNKEFLENYVYKDQAIRTAIVESYLEELEKSRPPRAISSRGKITLTPPDRPKSIAEAGSLIKSMLNNRRI